MTKNVQIKIRNEENEFDNLYPKTKIELVEGLGTVLNEKVDQVTGKGLSTEDYTTTEKNKLVGVANNANNYVHPTTSGNHHVPTGGTSGDLLGYAGSSGTASWRKLIAADIPTLSLEKISDSGTAASRNIGTAAGDVPVLDSNGKLDTGVLPALAITDTFVVANQTAMLALTAEVGDVAVRTDQSKSYILRAMPASTLANWQELLSPDSPVQSVAGKAGAVTLVKGDVGLGSVENYGIASKTEAEAGTATNKYMNPLRVKEAIIAQTANLGGGDMLKTVYDANNNGKVDVADLADSVPWTGVTGKPSTYTPSAHTHTGTEVSAATTSARGTVQLSTAINSTSTTLASTPSSVKQAYDLANGKSKIVVSATTPPADTNVWFQEIQEVLLLAKNILQKHWDGTKWDELHPVTKATNVFTQDGKSIEQKFDEHQANIATQTVLGHVKVGSRLSIDANGVLSADIQTTDISEKIDKSILSTTGDIMYASAPNTPTRLAKGNDGQILTVSGGLPTWSNAGTKIVSGTYTGNGAATRTINVGFDPKAVFIHDIGNSLVYNVLSTNGSIQLQGGSAAFLRRTNTRLVAGGFQIASADNSNSNTASFEYTAVGQEGKMFIIIDKTTNKIVQTIDKNYGIQVSSNELLQEITEETLINKIKSAYGYSLVFDKNYNVMDITITKTIEQRNQEIEQLPKEPTAEERLQALEDLMLFNLGLQRGAYNVCLFIKYVGDGSIN